MVVVKARLGESSTVNESVASPVDFELSEDGEGEDTNRLVVISGTSLDGCDCGSGDGDVVGSGEGDGVLVLVHGYERV